MNIFQELKEELFPEGDLYSSFNKEDVDLGYPHTNIVPECIEKVFEIINPIFWLEIGSMLGGSALMVAKHIREKGLGCHIVCVDPFCGDVNMWCWEKELRRQKKWSFLKTNKGSPTIKERFMANICHHGFDQVIFPLATTCTVGVNVIKRLHNEKRISFLPEVIYLDSSHQEKETFLEMDQSWALLKDGGVLFGDDWGWPGLSSDVKKFASGVKLNNAIAEKLNNGLAGSFFEDGVLLHRNHWFLCK